MGAEERHWLDVAYVEKDEAKALGARWDPEARRWYARPGADLGALARWAPRPPLPTLLPGELRNFGEGLFVDLIPRSCWFTNVRSCVSPLDWERLRRLVIDRAGNECEACTMFPIPEQQLYMECHERWAYTKDDTQKLVRLVCLCSRCHEATHMGLAQVRDRDSEAMEHLMTVEGMTWEQAEQHVATAFEVWRERNRTDWRLDLSMLTDAGIEIIPPRNRTAAAAVALDHAQKHDHECQGP